MVPILPTPPQQGTYTTSPEQGTAAEVMLRTLALLVPTMAEHDARLALFVCWKCPEDEQTADAVTGIITSYYRQAA